MRHRALFGREGPGLVVGAGVREPVGREGHVVRMWLGKQEGHPRDVCDQQEASQWGCL